MSRAPSATLDAIEGWDAPLAGIAVVGPDGVLAAHGDLSSGSRIASVTKVLTSLAVLLAVEEGAIDLDDPAGQPGSTVRDLLRHSSGYGFDLASGILCAPGERRVYSNRGYDELARHLERATEITFDTYLAEAVLEPLRMSATSLRGSAAFDGWSTVADLALLAEYLLNAALGRPTAVPLLSAQTFSDFMTVSAPGLEGVLPGVGRFTPLDWGLGPERNFGRPRHWAGAEVDASTFGHFGGTGSFLWVDPVHRIAAVCLTGREFGAWALESWPGLCDAIVEEFAVAPTA